MDSILQRAPASSGLASLWRYRRFIGAGALREIRVRYAGSAMGVLWHIFVPLVQIAVYFVLFSHFFAVRRGPAPALDYGVFMLAGILPWFSFADTVGQGAAALLSREGYLRKLPISEGVFVAQSAVVAAITMVLYVLVLTLVSLFAGVAPSWTWLLVPVVALLLLCFGFGLALMLAPLSILFRDLSPLVGIVLQLWFWITPILYDPSRLPPYLARVVWSNPVTLYIDALRGLLLSGALPPAGTWFAMVLLAAIPIGVGLDLCRRLHSDVRDAV